MKIMVIGHAGHAKDPVCELIEQHYGLSFTSSSMFACKLFIFDLLKDTHGYSTIEECFNDRVNHRPIWHRLIKEYQGEDKTTLTRAIFAENDIYCGNRCKEELHAAKDAKLVDWVIWVDASKRLPLEDPSSISVTEADADFTIDNNGTEEELLGKVIETMDQLFIADSEYFTRHRSVHP